MRTPGIWPLVVLASGFTVWSIGFVLLYALQALGCAFGWPLHRAVLVTAYLLTLLPLAYLSFSAPRSHEVSHPRLWRAALWANRAALAAGVLAFLPVTFASICV